MQNDKISKSIVKVLDEKLIHLKELVNSMKVLEKNIKEFKISKENYIYIEDLKNIKEIEEEISEFVEERISID